MRFILIHKVDEKAHVPGTPPSQEIIRGMGQLVGGLAQSGKLVDGAGLRESATRVRLSFSRGKRTVQRGPLTGDNELTAGFALVKVKSMDEAISWASKIGEVLGDVQLDLGPVTEAWDLGMAPKPQGEVPLRALVVQKASPRTESGQPLEPAKQAALDALFEEMKRAGVLQGSRRLLPSAQGMRLTFSGGKRTVVDGPFAESKELIAGFLIVDLASKDEALELATKYAGILGDIELDVLGVAE